MPIYSPQSRNINHEYTSFPITIKDNTSNEISEYSISANMVQSGTPSQNNIIIPQEFGNLVESGEHTGEYAIPITCGGSTQTVYLSEPLRKIGEYADEISSDGVVTRYVKKLVLTNRSLFVSTSEGSETNYFRLVIGNYGDIVGTYCICTHFVQGTVSVSNTFVGINVFNSAGVTAAVIEIRPENVTSISASDFKMWLGSQYDTGTPVTVWYVLATPTTESITMPQLSLNTEQINTISIDTAIQPSKVNINYYQIVDIPIIKIPIGSGNKEIKHVLDNQGNYVFKSPNYYTWEGIRDIVRAGKAPQYYPIGSIIYDNFNSSTGTAFQVVAYDNHFDPTLTAQGYTHSMTLCELLLTDVITFDEQEAFLYTNTSLSVGTYRFTIPDYDSAYGGNKTYYFTSTGNLPSGSQIVMTGAYQALPSGVNAYSPTQSALVQTVTTTTTGWSNLTLTEYIDGESPTATDLGTIGGPSTQLGSSNYGTMNHIHRARYGSNNYLQSGVRQYINSNSATNTWWTPQTIFDRPYGSRSSAGKLTKLNQDMVNVLATPTIQSRTNQYFETTSLDGTTFTLNTNYNITTDKMFLLSPKEVGFTQDSVGTLLDYYINATNTTRIKYRKSNNTAYYWWLRTPYPTYANLVRNVNTSGALNNNNANNSNGVASDCK